MIFLLAFLQLLLPVITPRSVFTCVRLQWDRAAWRHCMPTPWDRSGKDPAMWEGRKGKEERQVNAHCCGVVSSVKNGGNDGLVTKPTPWLGATSATCYHDGCWAAVYMTPACPHAHAARLARSISTRRRRRRRSGRPAGGPKAREHRAYLCMEHGVAAGWPKSMCRICIY